MSTDILSKKTEIGKRILSSSRSSLYFAMRFMDMALCAFLYEGSDENNFIGTDGNKIFFRPDFLIDCYEENVKLVNRQYLHMTLHCIYRHPFRLSDRKRQLWDISCDIAVEYVIDHMNYSCISMRLSASRDAVYRELQKHCKILNADLIYRHLTSGLCSDDMISRIADEFLTDDHNYWYRKSENPQSQRQNEQKWEDISSRLQTSIETVEKKAGTEDAGLYMSVKSENKKRYDYKEFLRKFAVYREVMEVDPDSFDYNFYTYGLNMYGNMPLIEPQEQKEIKKILDFVIVIDTSFSCSKEQVKKFLEETCQILLGSESFFKKVNIRVLQCDIKVEKDDIITNDEEMRQYIDNFEVKGRGGTDFRPAFRYVAELIEKGAFERLKGLIYFTDGRGTYPSHKPPYDTSFVFVGDDYEDKNVPAWAIKLEI